MNNITLYTYAKSSAAYRVRIALNLKKIPYDSVYISLLNEGGDNNKPEYTAINPQAMVPTLISASQPITQSAAIIEYLEETFTDIPLLPTDSKSRTLVRSYAQMIACDIHPLNNLRVLEYLRNNLGAEEDQVLDWYRHWIHEGFAALETRLEKSGLHGTCCINNTPSMADVYLIPQVYNAYRYQCEIDNYPIIKHINQHCLELDAFIQATPESQHDFVL